MNTAGSPFEKVGKILSEKFGVPLSDITEESELAGDLNLSSIEINDLVAQIRHEFRLNTVHESEGGEIIHVRDILNMIEDNSDSL